MLMCKYSNCCAAIKISEGCSYDEIVKKICAKFKELSVGNFCLFFFVLGYSNCIVECDNDLLMLLWGIRELWRLMMVILVGLIL